MKQPKEKLNVGIDIKEQGKEVIRIHKEYFDLPIIKKNEILKLLQNWITSQADIIDKY